MIIDQSLAFLIMLASCAARIFNLLDTAQHLMASSLPPLIWSYTPREFNRCADFLAGIARDHAREHFAHAPEHMSSLSLFPFPLPPSLSSLFAPVFNPCPSPSTPHFTFTEVPSLSLPLLPLLFRHFKQAKIMKISRFLLSRFPTSSRPILISS